MSVSINNIVKVNFNLESIQAPRGSYATVAFVHKDVTATKLCRSLNEVTELSASLTESAKNFFALGGKALLLIKPTVVSSEYNATKLFDDIKAAKTTYSNTENDFIFVTVSDSIFEIDTTNLTKTNFGEFVSMVNALVSPNKLIVCLTVDSGNITQNETAVLTQLNTIYGANFDAEPIVIKLSSVKTEGENSKLVDTALSIGAFYTNTNLDNANSLQDYNYTDESAYFSATDAVTISDALYTQYAAVTNFVSTIGSKILNFGGNLTNTESITTTFGTICAENDVAFAVLTTLLNKQYLTEQGLTNVLNTINTSLLRYSNNGLLLPQSIYSGESKVVTYNNKSYTVATKGQPLADGYSIFAVPVSAISVADKQAKKFPPIYVVMESIQGAKIVTIEGTVLV